jgi:hypothetical protein
VNDLRSPARIGLPILMILWAGAIIGISFIVTPVKFQAPSLTVPVGLEVGRYTFRVFTRIELCFLIAVIIAGTIGRPRPITVVAIALVAVQLLLQQYWLLPVLDRRVSQILAGGEILFSTSHWVYAAFEGVKTTLLITAAALEIAHV